MAGQKRSRLVDPIQERILAVLLLRPQSEWYRSELASWGRRRLPR
ncbi:MAG: hypothetical protein ACT4PE_17020 [Candidatus Eiseniibacteriota bacterium]